MDNQEYPEQRYVLTALLRYILAAVLFVVLVAFLAWFFFFRGTSDDTAKPTGQAGQSIQQKNNDSGSTNNNSQNENQGSGEQASGSEGANPSSTNGSTDATGESSTVNGGTDGTLTPNELSNTGPGDIVALFAVTVVVSTLGYRWRMLRKRA